MKSIATFLGAALLCSSLAVSAQTTTPPAGTAEHKGPTPEQREKMREGYKAAHKACEGKPDREACMREQFCAKAEDKSKCQARAREHQEKMGKHMDERQAIAEACSGKRGEELKTCYRTEAEKRGLKPGQHGQHGPKKG